MPFQLDVAGSDSTREPGGREALHPLHRLTLRHQPWLAFTRARWIDWFDQLIDSINLPPGSRHFNLFNQPLSTLPAARWQDRAIFPGKYTIIQVC